MDCVLYEGVCVGEFLNDLISRMTDDELYLERVLSPDGLLANCSLRRGILRIPDNINSR